MNEVTRERLFGISSAFDHPVTVWIVAGAAAVLAITPVVIIALSAAGRIGPELKSDLWKRYISWLVIAPAMCAPVLLGAAWAIAGVIVLSLLCYREFARATGLFRETLESLVVVLGILGMGFATLDHWYGLFVAIGPITMATLVAIAILPDNPKGYIQRVALGAFAFTLFGSSLAHLGYMANDALYRPLMLTILATVELNDVFAYITGKTFGRRKLSPNTSPKKTVGGCIGAILLTTPLVAFLMHHVFRGTAVDHPVHLLLLGLIVSVGGQLGDLVLSSIKRDIGVKDLGVLIPGHGGLLDRFDSILLVAPAVFHYVWYLRGIGPDQPAKIISSGIG